MLALKLIIATPSPFARKARVALLEKGLRFTVEVDNPWIAGASIAPHNPLKKVPVLVTPDDGAIFDSRVIVEYIEAKWPQPPLLPAAAMARVAVHQIEAIADGVCDAVVLIVLEQARPPQLQSRDWIARQMAKVEAGVDEAGRRLAGGPWFVAGGFGLADIAVGCMLGYLDLRLPAFQWRERAPALAVLFEKLRLRDSFRATQPSAQPLAAVR